MSLNIKNEEAHRLARQLAKLTGESMATAVTQAVRDRLERVRESPKTGLTERILEIGRDCAAHLREPYKSMDIDELLYDEKGMPK
jgi:antitoxin VapB